MASKKGADLSFLLAKVIALRYSKKENISSHTTIDGETKGGQPVDRTSFSWTDCCGREKTDRSKEENGTLQG